MNNSKIGESKRKLKHQSMIVSFDALREHKEIRFIQQKHDFPKYKSQTSINSDECIHFYQINKEKEKILT